MHILVLTDEIYPDGVGGVGKSLYNECVGLVRLGHQVTVAVRALNSALPPSEIINGLNIIRIFGPERQRWYYRLFPLIIIYQLARWLAQFKQPYDILYLHGVFYYIPVWLTRNPQGVPVVCSFYASMEEYVQVLAQSGKYGRFRILALIVAKLVGNIERWSFKRADAVLARSQFSLDELRQLYPEAYVPQADNLIPLCINTDIYAPQADARIQLDLPNERLILITVRRLDGRMGLTNLIEAVQQVRQIHPSVLLLIAGKGYLRAALEELITRHDLGRHVQLLGFVPEADLPNYLSAADLFVMPTESLEGFGLATVEALAAGVPVLGTPVGATPELLKPLDQMLLTSDVHATALAEGINYWLSHPEALRQLRNHSRTYAEECFSSKVVAARLADLFQGLIIKHRSHTRS